MNQNNIADIYPLTPAQTGMLMQALSSRHPALFVEQSLSIWRGPFDRDLFAQAWQAVCARHTALRTGFIWKEVEDPLQYVLHEIPLTLTVHDWRELDPAQQAERRAELLAADRTRGFALDAPPLSRITVMQSGADEFHCLWTFHHILVDGWCVPIALREAATCYLAAQQHYQPQLQPVRPYADYVAWVREQDGADSAAFWRAELADLHQPLTLGAHTAEGAEPEKNEFNGRRVRLSPAATARLETRAREASVTIGTVVQGAWALLLSHYSQTTDILFGRTVSGRSPNLPGSDAMVGLFINTVPLRVAVDHSQETWAWFEQIQARVLRQEPYEFCTAGQIQQWSQVPASRPLYESIVVIENYPQDLLRDRETGFAVDLWLEEAGGAETGYPLTLLVVPGAALRLQAIYDTRRFTTAQIERMLHHLSVLLRALGDGTIRWLRDLSTLIPAGENPLHCHLTAVESVAPPSNGSAATETPTERRVAAIWADLLDLPHVDRDMHFFAAGGHSLVALQLITRLRAAFGVELPIYELVEWPTVSGLAARIDALQTNGHHDPNVQGDHAPTAANGLPTVIPAPAERNQPFPLTDIQQAYWVGRTGTFALGDVATHGYTEIEGDIDLERFNAAWQRLIDRHDMLRAIVLPDGRQQILPTVPPYRIQEIDLRGLPATEVATRLSDLRAELSHHVLPADQWPLFDLRAARLDDHRTRLFISIDGLFVDGWSYITLFSELDQRYRDPAATLEPPQFDISFRDYVMALQELEESEPYQQALDFWRQRLPTLPPAPELPLARNPGSLTNHTFRRREIRLEAARWQRLKAQGAAIGLTPPGLLLAIYAEVLATWSKEPAFTINVPLFNRFPLHPQVNQLVGTFTSFTLVPVEGAPGQPFRDRAQRVQEALWQGLGNYYVSGVRLLREMAQNEGEMAGARMPVVFTSLPYDVDDNGVTPIDAVQNALGDVVYSVGQTPQVWLDNQVIYEHDGSVTCYWDAVDELFPPDLIDDMFAAYCSLLACLADDESAWTQPQFDLLPPAQRVVRAAINDTEAPIPPTLLHSLFFEQAARQPERTAVITASRRLTYGEVARQANGLGRRLQALGARPNELIAVVMEKGWEQVVATLGVLTAGAAYVPIDPDLPAARLQYVLENAGVTLVLTQSWLDQRLAWPPALQRICVDTDADAIMDAAPVTPVQQPDDLAFVIYTSGSTGLPKGAMLTHRGVVNAIVATNRAFGVGPRDRVLALTTLHHDMSVFDLFGVLAAGGAIVMPDEATRRDPAAWLALMEREQVTLWNSVPAIMEMLLTHVEQIASTETEAGAPGGNGHAPASRHTTSACASLRLAFLGGDWIPLSIPPRLRQIAPGARLISVGGPTETTLWNIWYPVEQVEADWKSIPYGRPIANTRYHIFDYQLHPRPDWVPGEIYCAGVGVARGYWRDPEQTAARFIVHPESGERLYRTGDMGRYRPDGVIEFLGRADFQIKLRGHRIEPGEIEAALAAHPAVDAAVVTLSGAAPQQRLVAYVVANDQQLMESIAPGQMQGTTLDPVERAEFKLAKHGLRHDDAGHAAVALTKPALNDALIDAYLQRQSYRSFLDEPIELAEFSLFLSALMQIQPTGFPLPKALFPSGGGLYPVQTYVAVKPDRIEGLAAGTYYYHPVRHELIPLTPGGAVDRRAYAGSNRSIYDDAAFSIFLVAQLDAIEPLYGDASEAFCLLEAGYMGQLLMETAPRHQLGLCPIGYVDMTESAELFQLEPTHRMLHSFLGGLINPEQVRDWLSGHFEAGVEAVISDELSTWLRDRLPPYMVPAHYMLLDRLPLTANGKVDRRALPSPNEAALPQRAAYVPPRNPVETTVAEFWAAALPVERVGIHDNFFEMGGDSLIAAQIMTGLRQHFAIDIPLRTLFDSPTVAGVAAYVETIQWSRAGHVAGGHEAQQGGESVETEEFIFE